MVPWTWTLDSFREKVYPLCQKQPARKDVFLSLSSLSLLLGMCPISCFLIVSSLRGSCTLWPRRFFALNSCSQGPVCYTWVCQHKAWTSHSQLHRAGPQGCPGPASHPFSTVSDGPDQCADWPGPPLPAQSSPTAVIGFCRSAHTPSHQGLAFCALCPTTRPLTLKTNWAVSGIANVYKQRA